MTALQMLVKIGADVSAFQQELGKVEKTTKGMADRLTGIGTKLSAAVTLPILGVGAASAKLAMDAVESDNLFEVSFGKMAEAARSWSVETSEALGLNEFELRKASGTLYTMLGSMGMTESAAFDMSKGFTQLAYDMASFYNIAPEEAFIKLRAGISGEMEPLKQLGILVDENTTKTYAYSHGIAAQGESLSQQQKILARYGAIMSQTGKAQGDLARTLDSPTNMLRVLKEQATQAGISLGMALMPAIKGLIGGATSLMPYLKGAVEWFSKLGPVGQGVILTFVALVAAAGPVILFVGGLTSAFTAALPVFGAVAGGLGTVIGTLGLILNPVTLVAAAIAALVIGIRAWTGSWDFLLVPARAVLDWLGRLWEWMKPLVTAVGQFALAVAGLAAKVAILVAAAAGFVVWEGLKILWSGLVSIGGVLWNVLSTIGSTIGSVLGPALGFLGGVLKTVVEWITALVNKVSALIPTIPGLGNAISGTVGKVWDWAKGLVGAGDAGTKAQQGAQQAAAGAAQTGKAAGDSVYKLDFMKGALDGVAGSSKEAAKAAKKTAEAFESMFAEFSGQKAIEEATLMASVLDKLPPTVSLTNEEQQRINETMDAAIVKMRSLGQQIPPTFTAWKLATDSETEAVKELKQQIDDLGESMAATFGKGASLPKAILGGSKSLAGMLTSLPGGVKGQTPGKLLGTGLLDGLGSVVKSDLGTTLIGAFQGGGDPGRSAGGLLGNKLGENVAKKLGGALTSKLGGVIGGAVGSIIPGLGTIVGGLAGSVIGKGIGKLGGLLGGLFGNKNKQKDADATANIEAMKQKLAEAGWSVDQLREKGGAAGKALADAWGSQGQRGLEQFTKLADKFTASLEEQRRKAEGLQTAFAGVNARAETILGPLQAALEAGGKDAAAKAAPRYQNAFNRLGTYAMTAFGEGVKQNGLAATLEAMKPTFDALAAGVEQFGLKGSESINKLLAIRGMGETYKNEFAVLGSVGQMLDGFGAAGLMTRDLFVTMGQDVAAQFERIRKKGGDVTMAMAMQQPILQQLWEAQQKYGATTDEATAKLLKQAEEQGLVGANMKDVNEKILDVLLAIGTALGATIPDSLKNMGQAGGEAADTLKNRLKDAEQEAGRVAGEIGRHFERIRINPIRIPYSFSQEGSGLPNAPNVPAMAEGGIVRRPTFALIGEAGPEAVVPLSQFGADEAEETDTGYGELVDEVRNLPAVIARSVRDAVLLSVGRR